MEDKRIAGYFATPFLEVRYPAPEKLNRELKELFLSRERKEFGNPFDYQTQFGALFESRFDLFDWPERPIRRLATWIKDNLAGFVATVNQYTPEEAANLNWVFHAWFHITRRGGYQTAHCHANASWSGIYCVEPGDDIPDRPESGTVRFLDPRGAAQMHIDRANLRLPRQFTFGTLPIKHEEGKLLLFPSYIQHEVLPYVGESERIVVAFNAWTQ